MPSLSVYLLLSGGMRHYQPGDDKGTVGRQRLTTYWTFRTLQTLVMQDYNAFAPDIATRTGFEQQTAKQRTRWSRGYLRLYASHPKRKRSNTAKF